MKSDEGETKFPISKSSDSNKNKGFIRYYEDEKNMICENCGEKGHFEEICLKTVCDLCLGNHA